MKVGEEFRNKTPPHPNHVKHADRRSTGGRYDTVASYYGTLSVFPESRVLNLKNRLQFLYLKLQEESILPTIQVDIELKFCKIINPLKIPPHPNPIKHADRLNTGTSGFLNQNSFPECGWRGKVPLLLHCVAAQ